MGWIVVKFTKEDSVEAVPHSWFIKESQECFWPPSDYKRDKILRLIQQSASPLTDWAVYPAVLLGSFDDFLTAQRKANKALNTTDLSSNSDKIKGRGLRVRKKNSRYRSNSSDSDNCNQSSDNNDYPIFRNKVNYQRPNSTSPDEYAKSTSQENDTILKKNKRYHRSHSTPPAEPSEAVYQDGANIIKSARESKDEDLLIHHNSQPLMGLETPKVPKSRDDGEKRPRENPSRHKDVPNDDDFKRLVMDELSQLNLKVNSLIDSVSTLINTRRLETLSYNFENKAKSLYEKIPIPSDAELTNMELWLADDNNYKLLVSELARIGGNSLGQNVRRILYRVVLDEVAVLYSWDGAKLKKAFKSLRISKAIIDAMKIQYVDSKENDIIDIIKSWLVKAKERMVNKTKEKNRE